MRVCWAVRLRRECLSQPVSKAGGESLTDFVKPLGYTLWRPCGHAPLPAGRGKQRQKHLWGRLRRQHMRRRGSATAMLGGLKPPSVAEALCRPPLARGGGSFAPPLAARLAPLALRSAGLASCGAPTPRAALCAVLASPCRAPPVREPPNPRDHSNSISRMKRRHGEATARPRTLWETPGSPRA